MEIPVVVQHRHVHLSEADVQKLFGERMLHVSRPIDQRNQYVSTRVVSVHGPSGSFPEVAVLGPVRGETQVELSSSDAYAIGIRAPLRISGDLDRSASVILKAGEAEIEAKMSTIIPIRHLHLPPELAQQVGVAHHDIVKVQVKSHQHVWFDCEHEQAESKVEGFVLPSEAKQTGVHTFDHVVVRVHPTFTPAFHLTKDEAAPHWIQTSDIVIL